MMTAVDDNDVFDIVVIILMLVVLCIYLLIYEYETVGCIYLVYSYQVQSKMVCDTPIKI